jgi:hypothetical protein
MTPRQGNLCLATDAELEVPEGLAGVAVLLAASDEGIALRKFLGHDRLRRLQGAFAFLFGAKARRNLPRAVWPIGDELPPGPGRRCRESASHSKQQENQEGLHARPPPETEEHDDLGANPTQAVDKALDQAFDQASDQALDLNCCIRIWRVRNHLKRIISGRIPARPGRKCFDQFALAAGLGGDWVEDLDRGRTFAGGLFCACADTGSKPT